MHQDIKQILFNSFKRRDQRLTDALYKRQGVQTYEGYPIPTDDDYTEYFENDNSLLDKFAAFYKRWWYISHTKEYLRGFAQLSGFKTEKDYLNDILINMAKYFDKIPIKWHSSIEDIRKGGKSKKQRKSKKSKKSKNQRKGGKSKKQRTRRRIR